MKPLISFIITYYNQSSSMLEDCLNSIFQLPLAADEREIIVIDDGSDTSFCNDEAAGSVLNVDSSKRNVRLFRQDNQGVSIARNKGIELAQGEYIQFVDADDMLIPKVYAECLQIIKRNKDHSSVDEQALQPDIVLFRHVRKEAISSSPHHFTSFPPVAGVFYMRNNNVRGAAWEYIFRKAILGSVRFTEHVAYSEDEEFNTRLLLQAEKVIPTTYPAYFYRPNPKSATGKKNADHIKKRLDDTHGVIRRLYALEDTLQPMAKGALRRKVEQLTMDYIFNTMCLTHSTQTLEQRVQELTEEGFFPLPANHYTFKYTWFRKFITQKWSRTILCKVLTILKNK